MTEPKESTHAYIGLASCGCCVAATVDNAWIDAEHTKLVADDVSEFITGGLHIERVTIEEARERFGGHKCKESCL